ncbi:hypothetical protein ABT298_33225 [Streptomyces sp. NPDC001034]|uniref:hypothetical protein n=1 Tax=Streptomyces sp. NPDC001034 TaxID=3154375 RepID=UPI00331FB11D
MTANRPPAPMPVLHGEALTRRTQATQWMLKAAQSQDTAGMEWTEHGVALLTAGRVWDVVRAPYAALGRGLDRCTDPQELRRQVTEAGAGAVWCDPYRPCLYFLVPPGTDRHWPHDRRLAQVECMGGTRPYIHYIGVPRLDRSGPPGFFWLIPPDCDGQALADPDLLYKALLARTSQSSAPALNTP